MPAPFRRASTCRRPGDPPPGGVEDGLRKPGSASAGNRRFHTPEKVLHLEGFPEGHLLRLDPMHPQLPTSAPRHEEVGKVGMKVRQPVQELPGRKTRKENVGHHEIHPVPGEKMQGFGPRRGLRDLVTGPTEKSDDDVPDLGVVLDHEDAPGAAGEGRGGSPVGRRVQHVGHGAEGVRRKQHKGCTPHAVRQACQGVSFP